MPLSLPQSPPTVRRAALTVHGAAYRYGDGTLALSDVQLCVHKGEHVAVLGASGTGKTTLLGLLSGRLRVCAGSVSTEGRVATIHQDLRLIPQLGVLSNVLHGALPRRRWNGYTHADRQKAVALLARVGLTDKLHARVSRLSGGQKQRVAIARALMSDPDILLADEPVASLDAATAHEIMGLLDRLRLHKGLTLVTVLHDRDLATAFADRLVDLPAPSLTSRGEDSAATDRASRRLPSPGDSKPLGTGERRRDAAATPVFGPQGRGLPATNDPSPTTPEASPSGPQGRTADSPPTAANQGHRPATLGLWALLALAAGYAYYASLTALPLSSRQTENLFPNLADFLARLVPTPAQFAAAPWGQIGASLLETLQMSLLGTTLAAVFSLPLAAAAARNLAPLWLRLPARFLLNVFRAVPSILWALLMVAALGLGPVAGVLALAAYSVGYLTKFYYETLEHTDPLALDALRELGASRLQRLMHGLLPQSRAQLTGHTLFMLEYNVRAAGVLGLVGAGGIGYELKLHLDYGNLHVVGTILLLLIALTTALDSLSSHLRRRLSAP